MGLAKSVARQPGPPIELNTLADVFLQRNMVREATAFLLDVLQGDDPAHDKLQTKARARAQPGTCAFILLRQYSPLMPAWGIDA